MQVEPCSYIYYVVHALKSSRRGLSYPRRALLGRRIISLPYKSHYLSYNTSLSSLLDSLMLLKRSSELLFLDLDLDSSTHDFVIVREYITHENQGIGIGHMDVLIIEEDLDNFSGVARAIEERKFSEKYKTSKIFWRDCVKTISESS